MPNPTRSREKPAPRSWEFGKPGHAIVGYLNNADIGFKRCHDAVREKVEPRQHTLTNRDGSKQTITITDPDSQAQWAENRIGHRLLAIQDEFIPLLRDWRTYVMRDAAKLHLTAEFTARLDEVEAAFMRLLTRRDFLTRRPQIRGDKPRLRVNHDLLNRRLNRIFDAIDRADTLIRFFEKPEKLPSGKRAIQRQPRVRPAGGITTAQIATALGVSSKTISRLFEDCDVPTPPSGDHGHLYTRANLTTALDWCRRQTHPAYVKRAAGLEALLKRPESHS